VKDAELAAVNGDASCTVAGRCDAIQELQVILEKNGLECRAVKIDVAGHCSLLDPFMEEFASEIRAVQTRVPATPIVSCVTGKPLSARDVGDPLYWARQLRRTVRFRDGLRNVLRGSGALLIEVGPGNYLTFQTAAQLPARGSWRLVAAMRHRREEGPDEDCLLNALGAAWTSGHSLNLNRLPDSTGAPRSARRGSPGA
jgi:phthiocerol/phenolphthiocerol synthesis type-I polyketide synthase E